MGSAEPAFPQLGQPVGTRGAGDVFSRRALCRLVDDVPLGDALAFAHDPEEVPT